RAVTTASLREPGAFEASNPAYPGIVGRLRARVRGLPLPPARLPVAFDQVCWVAAERTVFVRLADGGSGRFKPLRHCGEGGLTTVYARSPDGSFAPVPLDRAPAESWFRIQGFQLVPADAGELWAEIRGLSAGVFVPWFLAAMAI